jgi:hypothetical protein
MRSAVRKVFISFLISVLVAGVGILSLRMVNEPTEFLSTTGGFDFGYAVTWFVFGAFFFGIPVFAALLVGVGFFAALGFQPLKYLRRRAPFPAENDVFPPHSSS